MDEKARNPMAKRGFCFGLALWPTGIVPILAIAFSRRGLRTFDPEKHKGQWMARWGMILGVLYTLVFAVTVFTGLLTRFGPNAGQNPTLLAAEAPVDVDLKKEAIVTMAFVQRHSPWMHEHDSNGNVIVDQRGRPVLTPNGKRLAQYMDEAGAKGVRRFADRASYAVRKLTEDGVVIPKP